MDQRRAVTDVGGFVETSNMRLIPAPARLTHGDQKWRQGFESGYDAGWADAYEKAVNDPMTFCVCGGADRCLFVENVADGDVHTCWYCTFLDGEAPCPVESEALR